MMKRISYLIIIVLITFASLSKTFAVSYEIRGNLREWIKVFSQSPNSMDLLETRLKLELLSTFGKNAAFNAVGYFIYDGKEKSHTWFLQEAYVDYYSKILDIRFGKQVIAWGKADEINPTDVLNPQNLSNLTEDKSIRKIGLFSLKMDWKFGDFILETIWKPEFQAMALPEINSKWAFFSLPGLNELPPLSYPENKFKNTEWAIKLSRTISMFDFSFSYFDGWDNIFTPSLSLNPVSHQMQVNNLEFFRTKMIGADFAGSIKSVGIWGEFAYFKTEDTNGVDPFIKNPYFQFVIGADYTFNNGIKANLQYFQQYITKIDDDAEDISENNIISKLGIGIPLQQAASLRIEKKFGPGEAHKVELFGLYDIKHQGIMLQPKLMISPADAFMIEIGMVIYDGRSESIFGRFDKNDGIYLKSTYSF